MTSIELTAPAKVNLFLRVLGRRRDSYHNILTLFERISLSDTVMITKTSEKGIIVTSDKPITAQACDNIAYKAAELLLHYRKVDCGVCIHIKKNIPLAAGLGGGSSDAAAVLVGMNRLFGLRINRVTLSRLGSKIGADVPFFILNTPFAIGTGRGDTLSKVDMAFKPWHLLVYPGPFKASTRDIYARLDREPKCLTRFSGDATIPLPKKWEGLEGLLYNDLGSVAAKQRPVIGRTLRCLASSLGKRTIVSGSGPSVFCLYRTRKEALGAQRKLFRSVPLAVRKRWQVFIVSTEV